MMTIEEIKDRVKSGDFSFLVGLVEDDRLEAKSAGYDISTEPGKLELTKDVSSFANKNGGLIVIGAHTNNDPTSSSRRIDSITPFGLSKIDPIDYFNILGDWIYPKLEGIEIEWKPSKDDDANGLFYIFIPHQAESLRPFLIKKDIDPTTNQKRKEIIFGYAERLSHSSKPFNIETLHAMMRFGRENQWKQNVEDRIALLESRLTPQPDETERKKNIEQILHLRMDEGIDAVNLRFIPYYSIATAPVESAEVETFLSLTNDSISKVLENPRSLRYAGWDMGTGDRARLIGGELRRVKSDQYKLLDLYKDGTLILVCTADESLLGWGNTFGKGRINPLAFIEITYMYFDLYSEVIKRFSSPVNSLQVIVKFGNLISDDTKVTLAPHSVGSWSQKDKFYQHPAPENGFSFSYKSDISGYDVATIAYQIVRGVYAWFGIEEDKIPYVTSERTGISVDKLMNPKLEDK